MDLPTARVTERSFYAPMIEALQAAGGSGIQEVEYESYPDILFHLGGREWILSVKIGETPDIQRQALLQYLRHRNDSGITQGLIFFLPEAARRTPPSEAGLKQTLRSLASTTLIDAGPLQEERGDLSFTQVVEYLIESVLPSMAAQRVSSFPLARVVSLLQSHVNQLMSGVSLEDEATLRMITDKSLLMDLAHIKNPVQIEGITRFLAAYILLSQILFLRLLTSAMPDRFPEPRRPVTHHELRKAFKRVLQVNYRPIFEMDVLDTISGAFVADTFDLIWGLGVEKVRHDLPGRIFHELMPPTIRKILAAFYTRPLAADLLAELAIERSDASVLDPASGSGTILVAAYKRKRALFDLENRVGNPHQRFVEEDIFGSDIMPFAVHLTAANLSAMDPSVVLNHTQIMNGDSIALASGKHVAGVAMLPLFHVPQVAETSQRELYEVNIDTVDAVLMNPPFTKVERGISRFVDMERFKHVVGGEVGLWGHFIALADVFLKDGGVFGGVIPIPLLRGRESERVREVAFKNWTPLFIVKPTRNYGMSEWSEYRDILVVARKGPAPIDHMVKFALVQKDLTKVSIEEVSEIAQLIKTRDSLRDHPLVEIDSQPIDEVRRRFGNLQWFVGGTSFGDRDALHEFSERFAGVLGTPPEGYFREGYRPVPKGVSKFMFLTRDLDASRVQEAFLSFSPDADGGDFVVSTSRLGVRYEIDKRSLTPSLRTTVGLACMNLTGKWDYVSHESHGSTVALARAAGVDVPDHRWWTSVSRELPAVSTQVVVSHRINPYSPSTALNAFFSDIPFSPSNQVNVIVERDADTARAVVCVLNSIIFWAQFFLGKEESTGRRINIRFYELASMYLHPDAEAVKRLQLVYEEFKDRPFPALADGLDQEFQSKYQTFLLEQREGRLPLPLFEETHEPHPTRLAFDLAVCAALGIEVSNEEMLRVYAALASEMFLTRALVKD
jgi:hypothetical protein